MMEVHLLLAALCAYAIGSIPSAVWIGKFFYGIDVRDHGSGNAGATNTFRVLGKKAGIPVMIADMAKGCAATNLANIFSNYHPGSSSFINLQLVLGISAVIGHIFPVFAGFRGGKGIATLFGMSLALYPQAALICIILFLVILIFTHYVSLSAMISGISYPFFLVFIFRVTNKSLLLFALCISVLILITHRKNIERLLIGKESRMYLFKRKNR